MKTLTAILFSFAALQASAGSYYCNGATKNSGSSWYYPNGATTQSGSSVYYENGATLKSGSSIYFRNGATFVSGSSMYYSNGATLKSGSSYYHSNGATMISGSSCYYQNGSSMGSCPTTFRIQAGLGTNDLEVVVNLSTGELKSLSYGFTTNGRLGILTLEGDGSVEDIQYECSSTNDSGVQALLNDYKTMSSEQQSKVRTNICR